MSMNEESKKAVRTRLNRIVGQINGIIGMIDDEREQREVLQQVKAARSALKKVHCVIAANDFSNEARSTISKQDLEQLIEQMYETT